MAPTPLSKPASVRAGGSVIFVSANIQRVAENNRFWDSCHHATQQIGFLPPNPRRRRMSELKFVRETRGKEPEEMRVLRHNCPLAA
jgi:hypothetical protein